MEQQNATAVVQQRTLTPQQKAIQSFTGKINGTYVQDQLKQVLGKNSGSFATSIVEVFTNDTQLQQCDPNKVVQEAIKAATLKLPLNKQLGYAYLITFKNYNKQTRQVEPTPTLVIGYRGYIQLAMRTGQYRNINSDVVYEGELQKTDKLTGRISLDGERTSDKVEGFFAHFETINGFSKTLYMPLSEMANYALKYSPSFKGMKEPPTVDQLCDMAQDQAVNGPMQGVVGWRGDFISMAQKTVLRRLLSKYGYLSIEMMTALSTDEAEQKDAVDVRDEAVASEKPVFSAKAIIQQEAEDAEAEEMPASPI